MRRRYIGIAKSLDARVKFVVFPTLTAEIHAERRMSSDPRGGTKEQWIEVFNRHKELYQDPDLSEGADSIDYVLGDIDDP
jgi:hypothetical protein